MALSAAVILGLALTGVLAGGLGALMGIGGGIIVVPALVLFFGFDIKIAVAASLVAVVASSTAAGSVYIGKGLANMRLGMLLEIATTLGGIAGGLLAVYIAADLISGLFAFLLLITAFLILRRREEAPPPVARTGAAAVLEEGHEDTGMLGGSYFDPYSKSVIHYRVIRTLSGSVLSFFAGVLSGLLGVGGGFVKVPAMHLAMNVPMKVATATSNFMIGVTAVSSLFIYFTRGLVYPVVAAPVALGVVVGALGGARMAPRVSPGVLRKVFAVLIILVALQMLLSLVGVSRVGL